MKSDRFSPHVLFLEEQIEYLITVCGPFSNMVSAFSVLLGENKNTVESIIQRLGKEKKKYGGQSLFSDEEKAIVSQFIEERQTSGTPVTFAALRRFIRNKFKREYSNKQLQESIKHSFSQLDYKKVSPMEEERALLNHVELEDYVKRSEGLLNNNKQYCHKTSKKLCKVSPAFVLNIAECGYIPFCDVKDKEVIYNPSKSESLSLPVERGLKRITLLAGIWADGTKTKPFIITHRQTIPNEIFHFIEKEDAIFVQQDKGFINSYLITEMKLFTF